jgi:C-terminal processing protease CtpA/Prc
MCFTGYLVVSSQVNSLRGSLGQEPKSKKSAAESEDLEIQIRKDNDKPARIEIKHNGKQWSVTENEIDKLPAAIQQRVREVLERSGQGKKGTASRPNETRPQPTTELAMKTTLGVHVSQVSQALRKQLKLPEGVGLLVEHVVDGSAAATAGLQRYDVLHKLGDQLLINPGQLAVLVRMHEPESKVTLSVIRDGEVVAVEAVLKAVAVTTQVTGFDAFEHFHGHQGMQEMQNCAACHTGGKNGRKDDGLHESVDNYLFFHGTPGNAVLNNCSSCHVKLVKTSKIRGQTP